MKAGAALALMPVLAGPAMAEDWAMLCRYQGLPPMVLSGKAGAVHQMLRVGGRPAVPALNDGRTGGITRATVDGYDLDFFTKFGGPPTPAVQVSRDGVAVIALALGRCERIDPTAADAVLGPADDRPLVLDPPKGTP